MVSNESWAGAFWLRVESSKLEVGGAKLVVVSRKGLGARFEELGLIRKGGSKFSVSSWQIQVSSSQQIQVIKFNLAEGGLGSAVAVFQSDYVVFPQVIPDLDFDELH